MRLLLVEDDVMLGKNLQQALQGQNYVVDWVQTGLSALAALQAEHFDLAVMDLGLPGLDGIRVIEEVRSQQRASPKEEVEIAAFGDESELLHPKANEMLPLLF